MRNYQNKMNTTHLTPEQIAYASEMQLSGNYHLLPKEIKQHLAACDSCAIEVLEVNEISNLSKKTNNRSKIIKLAVGFSVAASLLIIATIGFLPNTIEKNTTSNVQSKTIATNNNNDNAQITDTINKTNEIAINDTKPKKEYKKRALEIKAKTNSTKQKQIIQKSTELIAQYKPDEHLEKLVERSQNGFLRSNNSINPFNIDYPTQKSIPLINNNQEEIIVEIYTNKGRLVRDETCTDSIFSIPRLENGLYYFKLINNDFDLLMVGRITVKN